ncbi:disease resistance protein RPV1 [Cryptomeria japonica]|uniref:disease resistance protein RPV1 n=1 Tax=Cryptomeria japonica TaxID=3369 RepID=UPI0027DA61E7|nr:disease resistance protein RPV1 [Cryptomeria japonica]
MLLKTIVNSTLTMLKREPLEVAKHPVGMDEIVGDFERSQKKCFESEQQVKIVGIVGFGGSGKTTIATELYNRKSYSFNCSSFLHDVRDAASKNALHTKQNKLLADLRIQTKSFDNVKDGKIILEKNLTSLRMLVVLDDVDHADQVDALLPPKESLGSGSLIIVTTREGKVLKNCGITSIYKMQPLDSFHAKQLFCWHAFLQPDPLKEFEGLVEKYMDVCRGLPLSLKVIGGQLYGQSSEDYWVSQHDKIKRILPMEILQRLRVSYDALDEEEKEIFLDIACFFIGERKSSAIALWDGSGWSGLHSWEMLHNKCLVELDGEECIRMHDHLRDLGREIAKKHSPSRIWFQRQSMDIQQGMSVRGIDVNINPYLNDTPSKEYMEMIRISNVRVGLQILTVTENDLTQECGGLFRGLLWLRWYSFKHRCIPSWLSLENIRVLEFIYPEKLEALWEDKHPPLQLRELLIGGADKLQIPRSIGSLRHLKRLSIDSKQLSGLPEEFCLLHSLEHLDLSGCSRLSSLPNHFGDLVNLRYLDFQLCFCLETLPLSFKQLTQLEHLDLCSCSELTLESDILENITSLKHFAVSGCSKLEVVPRGITNQASLRSLIFLDMKSLGELPASIGQLSKLEVLEISNCPMLRRLPTSLGNLSSLATLRLEFCESLESLPIEVRQLCSLQTLSVVACGKVYEMPSLAGLVSLGNLHVSHCPEIKKIEGLAGLVSLENLHVSDCSEIKKIHLAGLISSGNLHVSDCPEIKEIHLAGLISLGNLHVSDCPAIKKIHLAGLISLRNLHVSDCPEIKEIHLAGLISLRNLHVSDCPEIKKIHLAGLISSGNLHVSDCPAIKKIHLTGLISLGNLHVRSQQTGWHRVSTDWMAPGINSLRGMERLRMVKLKANYLSAFEACIQSIEIEKWPSKMTIYGRIFSSRVMSILTSFTFPGLAVADSLEEVSSHQCSLTCENTNLVRSESRIFPSLSDSIMLLEGEWIVIRVLTDVTALIKDGGRSLQASLEDDDTLRPFGGRLMVGERGSVVECFKQLFQTLCQETLCQVTSMS